MNRLDIGFVGGGRIARIILSGWQKAGLRPATVVVADPNPASLARLKERFPHVETTSDVAAAAARDVVFLATHPPALADAASRIAGSLRPDSILVSLAPKFTIAKLASLLGGFGRIVRSNPNAPSIVGAGFNPLVFAPGLTGDDRAKVRSLFVPLGDCPEVAEEKIEAFAVFTAMGPTYLWFQMQALREVAVSCGLSAEEADLGLERMVSGAARTLVGSGLSSTEVMDLVPVKPLAEMEPQVLEHYRTRIPALFEKIRP